MASSPETETDSIMSDTTADTRLSGRGDQLHPRCATVQYPSKTFSMRSAFRTMHRMCTVLVGAREAKYTLHTDMLVAASPFFDAALNGNFTEAGEKVVRLPEERAEIFDWFALWLYTGTLTTASPSTCLPAASTGMVKSPRSRKNISCPQQRPLSDIHGDGELCNLAGSPKYFLLIDIYALSDRLLTTRLSNHIIDTIARLSESTNSVPTPSDTWILYGDCTSFTGLHTCPCKLDHREQNLRGRLEDAKGEEKSNGKTWEVEIEGGGDIKTTARSRHSTCLIHHHHNDPLKTAAIHEGIRATAPIRDLILDLFTYKKTDRLLATHRDDWHPLFMRDLLVRMKRPGREALTRHRMVSFTPKSWFLARACEACRAVVGPQMSGNTASSLELENAILFDPFGTVAMGAGMPMAAGINAPGNNNNNASNNNTNAVHAIPRRSHRHGHGTLNNNERRNSRNSTHYIQPFSDQEVTSATFSTISAAQCLVCKKVYCAPCLNHAFRPGGGLDSGDARFCLVGADVGPCKPWLHWEVPAGFAPDGGGGGTTVSSPQEIALPRHGAVDDPRAAKRYSLGVCGRYHEHSWRDGFMADEYDPDRGEEADGLQGAD